MGKTARGMMSGLSPTKNGARDAKGRFRNAPGPGRPKGARSKATVMAEQLLLGELTDIMRAVVEKAKDGDVPAARLILDRLLPISSAKVEISLPPIKTADDVSKASDLVLAAICRGDLSLDDGERLMKALEARLRLIEATDWERGLEELEKQQGAQNRGY
jgi:hypothetical protein